MLYFVVRYNRRKNPRATQIKGSLALEITWTVIPFVLVLIMFVYGWTNWTIMKRPPKDAFTIFSTARMWSWSFKYPNGEVTDTMFVPMNRPVKVNVTSADVIHSMYIPAFRLKQDMVPGSNNFLWFIAEKEGTYDIFCAEYCGLRHSYMTTAVVVMKGREFDKWYNESSKVSIVSGAGVKIMPGLLVIKRNGCSACHSSDGTKIVGPSFKGIYGNKTLVLIEGKEQQVLVDDAYIMESIYKPNAKIVKGFQSNLMQSYTDIISKNEVKEITEFIKTLK